MRRLINHVRGQPDHIRELTAGFCTAVVVVLVALVWFNNFKTHTYALLNGDEPAQDKYFAANSTSLFGSILRVVGEGGADIASLLSGDNKKKIEIKADPKEKNEAVYPLPVSRDRSN